MRVALVSLATPFRRDSWSGIPWYTLRELQTRYDDLHLIDTPRLDFVVERLAALQRYGLSVRQRRLLGRLYASYINQRLEKIRPDIVLAVGAMHKMTFVTGRYPVVHVSDGLFSTIIGYYERFGRFRQTVLRDGHADHQRVLDKTAMVLFASDWSRNSALSLYEIELARTRVVPFGACLDFEPAFEPRRTDGPLNVLFVGYDWKRKGGDVVLATWRELRKVAPDTELHIIGCEPSAAMGINGVKVHGRLDKGKAADAAIMNRCFRDASLFFMPSRQEAYGMVFCEAAAYGLPSVATLTGGIPTVIQDNVTGLLHPLGTEPAEIAQSILALWRDPARYQQMSLDARRRYEEILNWRTWGDAVELAASEIAGASHV